MNNPYAVPSQNPPPSPQPPKKNSKILTYGGGCLGVFFGLILIMGVVGSLLPDQKTSPTPAPIASNLSPVVSTPSPTSKPTPKPTESPSQKRARVALEKRQKREAKARKIAEEKAEQRRLVAEREREAKEQEEAEARAVESERTDGVVTRAEYNRIKPGMSYSEVADIIGDGTEISRSDMAGYTTEMYSWENPSGLGNMNAMFQNDELISKAQFGLE